jgi:hypothetical protein
MKSFIFYLKTAFSQKSELFKFQILCMQVVYAISACMSLGLLFLSFDVLGSFITIFSLVLLGVEFWAIKRAEVLIKEKDYHGFLIALFLNLLILGGPFFPVSLLGFYALLNQSFRNEYLENLPKWLSDSFNSMDQFLGKFRSQA